MRTTRETLLRSAWFTDAIGTGPKSIGQVAAETYQPDGNILMPPLPSDTKPEALEPMLKRIQRKLGAAGLKAINKYIETCGLDKEGEAFAIVTRVFGEDGAAETAALVAERQADGGGSGADLGGGGPAGKRERGGREKKQRK